MLYVFFENHKDENGKTVATDVTVSSYLHGKGINFKRDDVPFKVMTGLLKSPQTKDRFHNEPLKMWSYFGDVGEHLLQTLQDAFGKLSLSIEFRECSDLEKCLSSGGIPEQSTTKFDPKNFFYNKAGVSVTQEITPAMAIQKLSEILQVSVENFSDKKQVKKLYLRKALEFHPDRNGGDGKKMSTLNMYWQVYNA